MVFEQVSTLVRVIFHPDRRYESLMIRTTSMWMLCTCVLKAEGNKWCIVLPVMFA